MNQKVILAFAALVLALILFFELRSLLVHPEPSRIELDAGQLAYPSDRDVPPPSTREVQFTDEPESSASDRILLPGPQSPPDSVEIQLQVDHADGGQRELVLADGGAIEVQPDMVPPDDINVRLRAYQTLGDEPRLAVGEWSLRRDGPTRLTGLPIGLWVLRAEVGWWAQPPVQLSHVTAEVRAGETTTVLRALDRTQLQPLAPVHGTLLLSLADAEGAELELKPLGRAPLRASDRSSMPVTSLQSRGQGVFDFAQEVAPGRYRLRLHPMTTCATSTFLSKASWT